SATTRRRPQLARLWKRRPPAVRWPSRRGSTEGREAPAASASDASARGVLLFGKIDDVLGHGVERGGFVDPPLQVLDVDVELLLDFAQELDALERRESHADGEQGVFLAGLLRSDDQLEAFGEQASQGFDRALVSELRRVQWHGIHLLGA